eukprot:SAG31_NODE_4155_length_3526_cov_1.607237_3_plen_131_part_00
MVLDGSHNFFPFGFIGFCSTLNNSTQLAAFKPSGFNAIMPYGECTHSQLDAAHAAGIKVAFSLKDIFVGKQLHYTNVTLTNGAEEEAYFRKRVSQFRTHPAVLCYYLNDEIRASSDPRLLTHQQWAIEEV